jgi:hypothetical protein
MSCRVNNPVMVIYDIEETGIKMPSSYNENDLVGDMLRIILNNKSNNNVIEIPVDVNMEDESSDDDEPEPTTEVPLVPVIPPTTSSQMETTPSPIEMTSAPTTISQMETTPSPLETNSVAITSSTPSIPEPTISTVGVTPTTSVLIETGGMPSGPAEYFTNKMSCSNKKNYLLFGIILSIFILIFVLILKQNCIKNLV